MKVYVIFFWGFCANLWDFIKYPTSNKNEETQGSSSDTRLLYHFFDGINSIYRDVVYSKTTFHVIKVFIWFFCIFFYIKVCLIY
jgi:hypothetical protein